MSVTVRKADAADAEGIVALGRAVVPPTYGPLSQEYAAWCLERWWSPDHVADSLGMLPHWVAVDGEDVVGVANLGVHAGAPVMWKLYVHPDHHGQGIGGALLTRVEGAADEQLTLEYLDGNDPAAGFYRSHGFAETNRSVIDAFPALTWVWMRKDL